MRSIATFVGLSLALPLLAQDPTPRTDVQLSPAAAYQLDRFPALEERVGGQWMVHYFPATKTPEMTYGTGIPLTDWRGNSIDEARRHANQALITYGDLLKLGTSEYRESIGARMGRSWTFTFDQYLRGVPCVGGRADVRINMKGVIALLGSIAYQVPADFDVTALVREETAMMQAWLALGEPATGAPQPQPSNKPRLVIWANLESKTYSDFYLAWECPISNLDLQGNGKVGRYYIDAKTGAVLHYHNDKHECWNKACKNSHHGYNRSVELAPPAQPLAPVATTVTVMAYTRTGQSAISPLINTPMVGFTVNVPGIGTQTTDSNGQFTIDIAAPVTLSVTAMDGVHMSAITGTSAPTDSVVVNPGVATTLQIFTAAATPEQATHANTYFWIHTANEWIRSIVGNSAQMNTADLVAPRVNTTGSCNAFYTGNTVNFYPTGGGCNNTGFSTVVVHEWGHGLDDRYGGISNATGDGLSEGWGDIIGMFHPLVDNPIVGIDFTTTGGSIRTGLNTKLYGTQTEVHAAGEIWMGFAWRLRENLRVTNGTPNAIAISNDIVISSIAANATNQANAVTQVFVADDDDGNLANGVPHYAELSAAAIAKGMPYPQLQVATVVTAALGNTTERYTPRKVTATAAIVTSGSITDVRLVYSAAGGASQTRTMIPNGATNGYQAMLPGIASGTVTYHVEATHSSGTVVRAPATGEYAYNVTVPVSGPFTPFFTENFEAATTTWTTTRQSGTATNDWQLGTPNGKAGTSVGVAWADPSAAVSSRVYGTDLGAGTSNGAYPASMNYYITSPVINCSGRTGCYLRFRRWLTVEEGIYDQATVSVNGQVIWANQANGNTVDTSWQTFEYPIPMADNNPSVRIEFRLISDTSLNLGGWNVDDVQIGTYVVTPLPAVYQMLPEQAAGNAPMTLSVTTQGPMPFVIAIGDTAGPTVIPGIPLLSVGGAYFTLNGYSDASGAFSLGFSAVPGAATTGLFWYSQVLTFDSAFNIVASNPHINLFTP